MRILQRRHSRDASSEGTLGISPEEIPGRRFFSEDPQKRRLLCGNTALAPSQKAEKQHSEETVEVSSGETLCGEDSETTDI